MEKRTSFIKLDENFRMDNKICLLMGRKGLSGVGAYIIILSIFGQYKNTCYEIPFSEIDGVANILNLSTEEAEEYVSFMVGIGLFKKNEKDNTFYSPRRKKDLEGDDEVKASRSIAGEKGMYKRWNITPDKKNNEKASLTIPTTSKTKDYTLKEGDIKEYEEIYTHIDIYSSLMKLRTLIRNGSLPPKVYSQTKERIEEWLRKDEEEELKRIEKVCSKEGNNE